MKYKKFKHWFLQIFPPISILFLLSDRGPALSYLIGMWGVFTFISFISIVLKLFNFKKNRKKLLRPFLTCFVFFTLFSLATLSYEKAKKMAIFEAEKINDVCNKMGRCPNELSGWEQSNRKDTLTKHVGKLIYYPAKYKNSGSNFQIDILQGTDLGDRISGGVDETLTIVRQRD